MVNNKKEQAIILNGYRFVISGHRIIIATKNKSEEELETITRLYLLHKYRTENRGRPLDGEFRLCMNPECKNAFYARRFLIKQDKGRYCTKHCGSKVSGFQKKEGREEEIKKKFLPWFLDLTDSDNFTNWDRAAEWIVDAALYRDPERIECLNMLVEWEPERVKEVRKKIKGQPKANWIVSKFEKTKKGKTLRSLNA